MRVHFPEPIYFIIIPREEVTVAVKHEHFFICYEQSSV